MNKTKEELWQESEDRRLEYEGYCRKIIQGLESQSETSGIRAIWELVQNARDVSDNAVIKIELTHNNLIFSHHGTPFDYTSFRALVKQDSSKDRADAETVGQYGTGFMTTHTFNRLVYVSAPYAVKRGKDEITGYVQIKDFELDRRKVDSDEGPALMEKQLDEVKKFWKRPQQTKIIDGLTSFRYELNKDQIEKVSSYLDNVVRLLPFVLVLNATIHKVEVENKYSNEHYTINKSKSSTTKNFSLANWTLNTEFIRIYNHNTGEDNTLECSSLKSNKGDVVIIPPYPTSCGNVKHIPSLFLWFPLLGTEEFGVNFIFHSERFYPVEKRNNIMLPGVSMNSVEKGRENVQILEEMMKAIFEYYRDEEHSKSRSLDMCHVEFPEVCENDETELLYKEMQELWKNQVVNWKVLPIGNSKHSINEENVKLLHPDFYSKLNNDQRVKYEPVIASYVSMVKGADGNGILIPDKDLIEWSEVVNRWGCDKDEEFFITVADVCQAIQQNSEKLFSFLMFLKDSGNSKMMEDYPLLPNRNGQLRKRGELYYGAFMDETVYNLVCTVMGEDADKMYDPKFLEICEVNNYSTKDLQKAITLTITYWRNKILNSRDKLNDEQLYALIRFCSASALDDFKNQRGKIMRVLPTFYGKVFSQEATIKYREEDEEDFYSPAFNLLLDYTLSRICCKDTIWVDKHKDWLLRFLEEYAPNGNDDRKKKLDTYGVLPNQNSVLCMMSSLKSNRGVPDEMMEIYQDVFDKDLKNEWVDPAFETLVEFPNVTPNAIAQEIEAAIVADMKQDIHQYEKVVRRIILKIGESAEWQGWFGQIDDKKALYTFNMKTGDAQKSLFSLMDNLNDKNLHRLAKLSEIANIENLIDQLECIQKNEIANKARFYHLHTIGKRIEDVLREHIGSDIISIVIPKENEDKVGVDDIQDGQDIVVSVKKDGAWHNIFFVEVKSKWDFNEAAHMSMRQIHMACLHPDEYALCCVDLRPYKNQDLTKLPESLIIGATNVKMDIGNTLFPMMKGILDADNQSDETHIKIAEYRGNIPAKVFEIGVPFDKLIEKIEKKVNEKLLL